MHGASIKMKGVLMIISSFNDNDNEAILPGQAVSPRVPGERGTFPCVFKPRQGDEIIKFTPAVSFPSHDAT